MGVGAWRKGIVGDRYRRKIVNSRFCVYWQGTETFIPLIHHALESCLTVSVAKMTMGKLKSISLACSV